MSYPPPPPQQLPYGPPPGQTASPGGWLPPQSYNDYYPGQPTAAPQYATPAWPPVTPGPHWATELAAPGLRLAARLIDVVGWLLIILAFGTVDALLSDPYGNTGPTLLIAWIPVSAVLYLVLPLSRGGSTLGKRLCRLRVLRTDGTAVGFGRALGREAFWLFAHAIPLLNWINPLSCLWDKPLRQCLHDKVAKTYVVRRPS